MEYYSWNKKEVENRLETLLVGDDLGICHMYTFQKEDWHSCEYKQGTAHPMICHKKEIEQNYEDQINAEFERKKEEKKKLKKNILKQKGLLDDKKDNTTEGMTEENVKPSKGRSKHF